MFSLRCLSAVALLLPGAALQGPGNGAWKRGLPAFHGLSHAKLEEATQRVDAALGAGVGAERYCFLMVKDGKIVHEHYYGDNKESDKNIVWSVGKTAAAAMVGQAVEQGLMDIDKPLEELGVEPRADFGRFWPQVTTRSILGQASGEGEYAPGTYYKYDSGRWINHISYAVNKAVGEPTGRWATKNFAEPMGIPDFWANQQNDISVGGGQYATCRDLARLGQLLLNKGKWTVDGKDVQLISEKYFEQMTAPAFPAANYGQGFLTWLNRPAVPPLFWERSVCPGVHSEGYPFGTPPGGESIGAGEGAVAAMGYLGQYIAVLPEHNAVAVTMGRTEFGSAACNRTTPPAFDDYDSHWMLTKFFEAFLPVFPLAANTTSK